MVSLSACGGGGGGSSASVLPAPQSTSAAAPSAPVDVAFSIAISQTSSVRRSPKYVSRGMQSVTIGVAGAQQAFPCPGQCTGAFVAPPGMQTISATLFDGQNGTGNALATGSTTTSIVVGTQNAVRIVFGGIVASVTIAAPQSSLTTGTPAQVPMSVTARDAAGFAIVGSDPYATPLALRLDDPSGATTLSTATVTSPATSVMLAYNGAASAQPVRITASVPNSALSSSIALAVAPAATPAPAPSAAPPGTYPDHVRNYAYYGLNGVNAAVPAAWMAAHVDMVEDDGFTAPHADAFKRAGGKFALAYTDPTYVPYCAPPFAAPAGRCDGPIGNLVAGDETAWMHDASGARVHRVDGSGNQYQEALNAASAAAQGAYARTTAAILAASPRIDAFEADDSGSPLSSQWTGFNAAGVEYANDAAWIAGESAMLARAGRPVIVNGGDPSTWGVSYGGTFVDLPSVMGQQFEGCFNNGGNYLYTDSAQQFQREENGLLAVQQHQKLAMCYPTGDTSPAHRMYAYAAWLLAYDPNYSGYQMTVTQSDGYALYPETQLVPLQPRKTAATIADLRNGAVYVREFAACAIAGTAIGPCAAVVNSSPSATSAIPALSVAYAHAVALDAASMYTGGKANVVAGAPSTLAPASAAILVR